MPVRSPDQAAATNPTPSSSSCPRAGAAAFPLGTPLLQAARSLGVDIDSVCGGRGICGRCQIEIAEGEFAKLGVTSKADHLSGFGAIEQRYAERRGLQPGRRLSCSTLLYGDAVIDVPSESQVHQAGRAQAGRDARYRARSRGAPALCRGGRAGHARSGRRPAAPGEGAARAMGPEGPRYRSARHPGPAEGAAPGRVEGDRRRPPRHARSPRSGRASTTRSTGLPSTSARPPSPAISAIWRAARSSPRPG